MYGNKWLLFDVPCKTLKLSRRGWLHFHQIPSCAAELPKICKRKQTCWTSTSLNVSYIQCHCTTSQIKVWEWKTQSLPSFSSDFVPLFWRGTIDSAVIFAPPPGRSATLFFSVSWHLIVFVPARQGGENVMRMASWLFQIYLRTTNTKVVMISL